WPINHMVAPKEESLSCSECHNSTNSRLANLNDFYLPGRDSNEFLDAIGRYSIILAVIGVIIHGLARVFSNVKLESAQNFIAREKKD
ncbi:MAG: hypothetical protein KAQ79_01645, partial [Cyclobacteriaceae bacterium]|nr:hypothetical protein [Cyclobacteriaceae bacterium]